MSSPTWIYKQTQYEDPALWTVGFYTPDGSWHPDSDHLQAELAAARVRYLNGGAVFLTDGTPVLQDWVCRLPFMQQSVLIAAVRAPDGLRKDHPVKVIMRWYRRCVLLSAFERRAILDPFTPGGGSFTGPYTGEHARLQTALTHSDAERGWAEIRKVYLRHVDEMPHHFQLHLMHAAQIVGFKHSDPDVRKWWLEFYFEIVNDAHLFPESEELMDKRLGDTEADWRAREEVTAI